MQIQTVPEWEALIGDQVRRARLDADLDQRSLASRADISVGALRNLEHGRGAQLQTVIRAVRALRLEGWLGDLYPATTGPLELARQRSMAATRKRASPRA